MTSITILGSGTSTGIPMLGCQCPVCTSQNKKNQRLRSSILLEIDSKKIIVDTTPDLRTQLLTHQIRNLDAVVITHEHADHLHGIDDVRPFCFEQPLPLFSHEKVIEKMKVRFPYLFRPPHPRAGSIPLIQTNPVSLTTPFPILNIPFEFFLLPHGPYSTLGFVQNRFAYLIDCSEIPDPILKRLKQKKLELLIIDCVRKNPHRTHLNVQKAFDFIALINPQRAGLIHMGHELEHDELKKAAEQRFNSNVFPLFDGMILHYS
jgi:phosphoribosyl 1,2-cyclic phosphate phosphodiesterase